MNRKHPAPPNLGTRIRGLRKQKQWSIVQLSDASGISKSHLSQIERGEIGNPTIGVLSAIAEALELSISELLRDSRDSAAQEALGPLLHLAPPLAPVTGPSEQLLQMVRTTARELAGLAEHAASVCHRIDEDLTQIMNGEEGRGP